MIIICLTHFFTQSQQFAIFMPIIIIIIIKSTCVCISTIIYIMYCHIYNV